MKHTMPTDKYVMFYVCELVRHVGASYRHTTVVVGSHRDLLLKYQAAIEGFLHNSAVGQPWASSEMYVNRCKENG